MLVELRTTKKGRGGDGTNHREKLEHKRVSCASQFTIPDAVGMRPDPVCNNTNT
jgi:hypothetical protein